MYCTPESLNVGLSVLIAALGGFLAGHGIAAWNRPATGWRKDWRAQR